MQRNWDSQNVGQITWNEFNIHSQIPVFQIQVIDKDMNEKPDEIEKFEIHVWSNSDPIGIIISLYENRKKFWNI